MVKVFVSQLDTYTGKIVGKVSKPFISAAPHRSHAYPLGILAAQLLAQSVVGATREEGEEEEGDAPDKQEGASEAAAERSCYEVVGTLLDQTSGKPEWAAEVVEVS